MLVWNEFLAYLNKNEIFFYVYQCTEGKVRLYRHIRIKKLSNEK